MSRVVPFLVRTPFSDTLSLMAVSSLLLFSSMAEKANVLNFPKSTGSAVTVVLNGQTNSRSLVVSRLYIEKAVANCSSVIAFPFLHSFLTSTCLAGFARLPIVSNTSFFPAGFSISPIFFYEIFVVSHTVHSYNDIIWFSITSVIPYSPAELAGVKTNDIIIAIDGVQTTDISSEEIGEMLNPAGKNEVLLTIGNLANPAKQVLVKKECKKGNAITEEQLATAFSMYSLETTSEREFVCPFKTTVTADPVDFGKFKTFAFSAIDENNSKLETAINESIEKELTKKGMTVDTNRPDIIVQTFYFFDKNPNYKGANKILIEKEPIYRYNFNHSKMETLPFS